MISESIVLACRYRIRGLRRAPLRSAARALLLGCAVGPAVALSMVVSRLDEASPYAEPERVAIIGSSYSSSTLGYSMTFADIERLKASSGALVGVAASQVARFGGQASLFDYQFPDHAVRLKGARVSPSFFEVLGTPAQYGRVFTAVSVAADGPRSIVVRAGLLSELLGDDQFVPGMPLRLGGVNYSVIGVMPTGFTGPEVEEVDLWIPWVSINDEMRALSQVCCLAVVRLRNGVSHREAGILMSQGLASKQLKPVPIERYKHGDRIQLLRLLALLVGLIAVLSVVVLAHSRLSETTSSENDLGAFRAIGASRWHLLTLIAVDDLITAITALPFTSAFAIATSAGLATLVAPTSTTTAFSVTSLVSVAVATSMALAFMVGLGTMLATTRLGSMTGRAGPGRATMSLSTKRSRDFLSCSVAILVTVALVLTNIVASGASRLAPWRLGFSSHGVIVASLRLDQRRYAKSDMVASFTNRALDALSKLPGVTEVTFANYVPVLAPGRTRMVSDGVARPAAFTEYDVHAGFFELLQIPLHSGRLFGPHESESVAIVSRSCLPLFNQQPVLGTAIGVNSPTRIVGVVEDVVSRAANWDSCAMYRPADQEGSLSIRFILRTPVRRPLVERNLREALAAIDVTQPVDRVESLEHSVATAISPRLAVAGAIVLSAAAAWLLGVVWFSAAAQSIANNRRAEIGLRMAVGGSPARVTARVLWREGWPLALGLAVGLLAAMPAAGLTRYFVYTLNAPDVLSGAVLAVAGLLAIALFGASPIWRCTHRPVQELLRY